MQRLYGGHRNQVFKTDGVVKVVWRDGFKRKGQIREGVLLENFVATHTDIRARMLVDKAKPFQEENGQLVTYFQFVPGEIRYPWTIEEIASAARLLGAFHSFFKDGPSNGRTVLSRLFRHLHLDFARGNVLFEKGESNAIGIIDFENTAKGPIEQELGRTLSFLLVDTPIANNKVRKTSDKMFKGRTEALLTNYPGIVKTEEVFRWTRRYLELEDYGSLNSVRDQTILWIDTHYSYAKS